MAAMAFTTGDPQLFYERGRWPVDEEEEEKAAQYRSRYGPPAYERILAQPSTPASYTSAGGGMGYRTTLTSPGSGYSRPMGAASRLGRL